MQSNKHLSLITAAFCTLGLVGCGGSGGNDSNSTGGTGSANPTWTAGSYFAATNFQNYCAIPRTGTDPYNSNKPYPDKAGTALHEKMWLRSWSNETYLWYSEIVDQDPNSFSSVAAYFAQLKTTQTTDSGAKKDNFHFSESTEDYNKRSQSGVSAGYGLKWALLSTVPPRVLKIAYVQAGTPAAQAGAARGDQVLEINGVSINDTTQAGIDVLNSGLFPDLGQTYTFKVRTSAGVETSYAIVGSNITEQPVQNASVVALNGKKIGYMQFNSHISAAQDGLIAAFNQFNGQAINELVVDMRYNGGGLLAMASQLGYMVAGSANIQGRYFEKTVGNNKQAANAPTPFYTKKIDYAAGVLTDTALPTVNLSRVYVLSTDDTCSASEAFVNGLRGIDVDVVLIGGKTCGKPYGFYPTGNCGTTYYTIQFKGENYKGFGEYADGFVPTPSPQFATDIQGCQVADDFSKPLGDRSEQMFAAALQHIATGTCPASNLASAQLSPAVPSYLAEPGMALKTSRLPAWLPNKDMTLPREAQ